MADQSEKHVERVRTAVDEADAGKLVDAVLEMAADDTCDWGSGLRSGLPEARVLDILQGLRHMVWPHERELASSLSHALVEALVGSYDAGEETRVRHNMMTLFAVSPIYTEVIGKPIRERMKELPSLDGQHDPRQSRGSLHILVEAELAAGRSVTPAVVAEVRRSVGNPLAERLTEPVLNIGEEWAECAVERIGGLDDPWRALLVHAMTATASKPAAKWDKRARELIDTLGADRVRETVLPWLALVGRPRTLPLTRWADEPGVFSAYDPYNANALRGLAWLLSLLPPHPDTARALGALCETSLKKVAGLGPRNPKVANAAVFALARVDSEAALAELARLVIRVKFKTTAKLIDEALTARANALGLSREEIEELAVPAYGLTEVGRAEQQFGETTAVLAVHGSKSVLSWRNAVGKTVKSVPAAVRREHADELKELKAAVKDIDKMLPAQSDHLDRQFLAQRTWAYDTWRERYLDHPLVGTLARRLLWTVDGTPVGFADGELRTLTDTPVAKGSEVTLWHPIGREPAETLAWRDWLERHAITQPFKQAHREVYVLTDAERATGTYSNRFAAHVVRQHQFNSLAAIRGWRSQTRVYYDGQYAPPATRELPQWGLRAEFWIEGDGESFDEDEVTESGSFLRLLTDQVRFYPIDAPENESDDQHTSGYRMLGSPRYRVPPLPLTEIPPLVLSEVLRDADLFVGVASIGNDPTWQDGGPGGRLREYWRSYGLGELDQGAETRRALLERLIPRLAIAGRCHVEGRFLHVKGERHTYKIHLRSGNVLISPHDQYLCIVPKPGDSGPETGYLPFEGDRTLAVVLSKAMLLANDTKIKDPTILSQL